MYENAVGKFLTYAEARQKEWQCEKCSEMFASYKSLTMVVHTLYNITKMLKGQYHMQIIGPELLLNP